MANSIQTMKVCCCFGNPVGGAKAWGGFWIQITTTEFWRHKKESCKIARKWIAIQTGKTKKMVRSDFSKYDKNTDDRQKAMLPLGVLLCPNICSFFLCALSIIICTWVNSEYFTNSYTRWKCAKLLITRLARNMCYDAWDFLANVLTVKYGM